MNNLVTDMKLSKQALGAMMMALQKSLLEQSDIVPVLEEFDFILKDGNLYVKNPPIVKFDAGGEWLEEAGATTDA
tara:strand:- start:982 stop:1206 length:225 start_codon:yes stop_codon:yes gene_type:complete